MNVDRDRWIAGTSIVQKASTAALIKPAHILLLFVDGLGLPPEGVSNSHLAAFPTLVELLSANCVPLDATLGVPGMPQSATGQTALFTGVNAAQLLGRHVEGFPPARLRELLHQELKHLRERQMEASEKAQTFEQLVRTVTHAYLEYIKEHGSCT